VGLYAGEAGASKEVIKDTINQQVNSTYNMQALFKKEIGIG